MLARNNFNIATIFGVNVANHTVRHEKVDMSSNIKSSYSMSVNCLILGTLGAEPISYNMDFSSTSLKEYENEHYKNKDTQVKNTN